MGKIRVKSPCVKSLLAAGNKFYLAPLNNEINERNDVMQRAMRPGTMSDGINTEDAEATLNIILREEQGDVS